MILISVYRTKARYVLTIFILYTKNYLVIKYRITSEVSSSIFCSKKYSYYVVQQELARINLNVSRSTLSRIASKVDTQRQLCSLNSEKLKFRRHRATPSTVRRITS